MSNEYNGQQEALTQEEMNALAEKVITPKLDPPVPVLNQPDIKNFPIPGQEEAKIIANPETVRLPGPNESTASGNEEVVVTTEILHDNVTVGAPDPNYKRQTPINDNVSPEFAAHIQETENATVELQKQQEPQPAQVAPVVTAAQNPNEQGVIINNAPTNPETPPIPGMSRDSQDHLEEYLKNMGPDMAATKELRDQFSEFNPNLQPVEGQDENPQLAEQEQLLTDIEQTSDRLERSKEAIVIIDKLESRNLQFTPEEHEKLEKADVIRLNEVKVVELKTIKKRRDNKPDVKLALQRQSNTMRTTNILAPSSGYYAEMIGCAPYEIMTLQNEEDPITDNQVKWKLIFDKIKSNSYGFKTFEEFMACTAVADYETFIWGILRSTFEDQDRISINCQNPKCVDKKNNRTAFEISYSVTGLLRGEEFSDKLRENISRVVDAKTVDEAKQAHKLAPVNDVLAIQLEDSNIIFEICIDTVSRFINSTLENLSSEDLEPHMRQAAVLATAIHDAGIPDGNGDYNWYDEHADVTEIIYKLSADDLVVLANMVQKHTSGVSFKFGFVDVTCPKCKNYVEFQPMQVDSILFYRNALSMNVSVE